MPANLVAIVPVQPGRVEGQNVPLYLLPAMGHETAGLRRLGKALGPEWSISLVCPADRWYDTTCYPIEEAARAAAAVICDARPKVPFVVGGYCLGGVIACETARLLRHEGCAGLLLFDTPVPGYPKFTPKSLRMGALGRFVRVLIGQWKQPNGKRFVRRFILKRTVWYTILVLRPLLRPVWHQRWVDIIFQGKKIVGGTPLFWRRRLDVPILHFLATPVGQHNFRDAARFDWEPVAPQGITQRFVSGDHHSIFFRPNLSVLAAEIRCWCHSLVESSAGE